MMFDSMNKPDQDEQNLSVEAVFAFSKALQSSAELARKVRSASRPQEIIDIAESINIRLSIPTLRRFSKQLSAPYWPWDNQPDEVRRRFFETPVVAGSQEPATNRAPSPPNG